VAKFVPSTEVRDGGGVRESGRALLSLKKRKKHEKIRRQQYTVGSLNTERASRPGGGKGMRRRLRIVGIGGGGRGVNQSQQN